MRWVTGPREEEEEGAEAEEEAKGIAAAVGRGICAGSIRCGGPGGAKEGRGRGGAAPAAAA